MLNENIFPFFFLYTDLNEKKNINRTEK